MTNYRRKPRTPPVPQVVHIINEGIKYPQVRVIDSEGEMLGILKTKEALKMAFDLDMDLIEINAKAEIPVCKIQDYSKFKFQNSKAESAKPSTVEKEKAIRLSVRIAINDLQMNAKKVDEFLNKKIKVKIQIKMRGRERSHPLLSIEVMNQFLELITTPYDFVAQPKLDGDSNICTIKPQKK